jgi:hypothetical protein
MYHHTQFIGWDVLLTLCSVWPWTMLLSCLLSSWDYRCKPCVRFIILTERRWNFEGFLNYFFGSTGVWIQGFALARQVLLPLYYWTTLLVLGLLLNIKIYFGIDSAFQTTHSKIFSLKKGIQVAHDHLLVTK